MEVDQQVRELAERTPNFGYLLGHEPLLVAHGATAEASLFTDPNIAMIKCSRFGDLGAWFHRTVSGSCDAAPPFVPPQPRALAEPTSAEDSGVEEQRSESGGSTECGCIDAGQRRVSGMCSPVMR